jgi:Flp pilus assembly protein TadG
MVPLASLAALICVGIAVDFSGRTQAEQNIRDIAAHCARVGAQEVDISGIPGNAAINVTYQCLTDQGVTGKVYTNGDTVSVIVEDTYTTRILSIILINELPIKGTGSSAIIQHH